jgi:hypothetical protein
MNVKCKFSVFHLKTLYGVLISKRTRQRIEIFNPLTGSPILIGARINSYLLLAIGVELDFAAFDFFLLLFLAVLVLATGVEAVVVAAKAEPETTPKNKTDKITANIFFINDSL